MKNKKLKCDYEECQWEGFMRTKCKNENSKYYKKYLCPYHAKQEQGRKVKTNQRNRTEQLQLEKSEKRKVYFDYHIDRCFKSEESGKIITEPSRLNICHILPKSYFPSVGEHLYNFMYLDGEEHTEIDNLIFKNKWEEVEEKFPNVWEKIVKRLRVIVPEVTENHNMLRKLKEYLKWD